jgi:murein DD-endopeptidase MepM/ murein hydrolase activator NlpD
MLAWALVTGPAARAWAWPADGAVLREFSVGTDKYAGGQHRGIDVALGDAPSTRAPASGEVTFAGSLPTYGATVTIATAGGYRASLMHLGDLRVRRGEQVSEGQPIADGGTSGEPEHSVPYVHLGIRLGSDDDYVDPLTLLPPRGAANPPPAPAAAPAPAPQPAQAPPVEQSTSSGSAAPAPTARNRRPLRSWTPAERKPSPRTRRPPCPD